MTRRTWLASGIALGIAASLLPGQQAFADTFGFANGNPGDWADTSGSALTVTTSNTGGPSGAGYTTLPNLNGFVDNGPYTFFGSNVTAPYQFVSQSIAVYLDPTNPAFQTGQFMLDETPSATGPSSQLFGAEEDIIVTGSAGAVTFSGSTGNSGNGQTFSTLGTITQAGWYDMQMTWTAGAALTDPLAITLSVTDLTNSSTVGTVTTSSGPIGSEADLYQSQYLGGPGYLWFTYWDSGFANGQLEVANVDVQTVPEPSSLALLLAGTVAMTGLALRRRA
jgi:hypothetical protein